MKSRDWRGRIVLGVICSAVIVARRARWVGVVRRVLKDCWREGDAGDGLLVLAHCVLFG